MQMTELAIILGLLTGLGLHILVSKLRKTDPVYGCDLYKKEECAHVDGYLCDYPKCSMLEEYLFEQEQQLGIPYKDRYYNRTPKSDG